MGRKEKNQHFNCQKCLKQVDPLRNGSYRNHCPFCLTSLHVDKKAPGDRESSCLGLMNPIDLHFNSKKGWQILHQCVRCGVEKYNKVAVDDPQPDNWNQLILLTQPGKK